MEHQGPAAFPTGFPAIQAVTDDRTAQVGHVYPQLMGPSRPGAQGSQGIPVQSPEFTVEGQSSPAPDTGGSGVPTACTAVAQRPGNWFRKTTNIDP